MFASTPVTERKVRTFSLQPSFMEQFKGRQPNWGYGGLGYFTYKRTYSRALPDGSTEEWWQTCQRVVEGVYNIQKQHCRQLRLPWNEAKSQNSAKDMFQRMWDFKFLPPGRGLWVMGTDLVYEKGSAALQNCSFFSTDDINTDFAAPFCFLMDMSMLGVGVGGDTRGAGKVRLQNPKLSAEPFVVDDSREGWVDLARAVLNSLVGKGTYPAIVDYRQLRPRGAPLKTFGGVSSGPDPLKSLVQSLTQLLLPKGLKAEVHEEPENFVVTHISGKAEQDSYRITSGQIVDIFNYVGKCVVAGGIRRTAEIVFGEPDDQEFIQLKQDQEALMDRRWASNNSIFARMGMNYTALADTIMTNGEPGLFWVENARKFGRMADPPNWKDSRIMGTNPCVTGDTLVFTSEGPRRVDKALGKQFTVVVNNQFYATTNEGLFKTGTKPVFLVQTKEGHALKVTADHKILAVPKITRKKRYEMWVEAEDLEPGDMIALNNTRDQQEWQGPGTENEGWLLGSLLGDGCFDVGSGHQSSKLSYWGPDKEFMLEHALKCIEELGGDPRYHKIRKGSEQKQFDRVHVLSSKLLELAPEFGISQQKEICNDNMLLASSAFQRGFVKGLFDADGSVQGNHQKGISVRLTAVKLGHLILVQKMLLHFGINSTIYKERHPEGARELPDGRGGSALYQCQAVNELVVSQDNIAVFAEKVGFVDPAKQKKMHTALACYKREFNRERFVATVQSINYVGVEDVYDCTVPEKHAFGANGVVVHNCGEIALESAEFCNLVECFPATHDSFEDFQRTLKMAYLYAKTITLIPSHDPRANAVMMRNRRIGCSLSGIQQAKQKLGYREFIRWCDEGYGYIQKLDQIYSDWLCIPRSIKTTTVKPSGTVSILTGATPGIHHAHSEYYIRNVRVQNTSPLLDACRNAGYAVESDAYSDDTAVVSFPVHEANFSKGKNDVTIWEQFADAAALQRYWADNQVSVTISTRPDEKHEIATCLEVFEDQLKSVSLLPTEEHGYVQAPYIEITKEQYEEMMSRILPLDLTDTNTHEITEKFCSNDSCELPKRN